MSQKVNPIPAVVILSLFLGFSFCLPAQADLIGSSGHMYVYTYEDPVITEAYSLVGVRADQEATRIVQSRLKTSRNVLALGDGFGNSDYKLAETLAKLAPSRTIVYKAGLDAPVDFEMGKTLMPNLAVMKIDHQRPVTFFEEGEVDTIVMRKGLCHCWGDTTCGGLRMGSPCPDCGHTDADTFFQSVGRILNKKNPNAIAFLHGVHNGNYRGDREVETQNLYEGSVETVEKDYPELEGRLLYVAVPTHQTRYFSGKSPQISGIVLKGAVPVFIGVEFTVRPKTP